MNTLLANQAFINSLVSLATNLAILIGVVTAFVKLRTTDVAQGEKIKAVEDRADRQAAAPSVVVAPIAAGGGAGGRLLELDPVRQGAGVTVSAAPNATGDVDCGLACVVSVIGDIKGTWSADELLRLRYFGVVDRRLTNAHDIVGMLRANDIPAHERQCDAETARIEITRNWEAGRSSIVLGDWISPGYGHWMRFLGDDGGAEFMDPWPGTQRRLSWAQFAALYDGWYVHIDAAPPAPLCGAVGAGASAARETGNAA